MAIAGQHLTAEELLALPDDGMRHELIDGVLHTMSPPGGDHGLVAGNAYEFLAPHVRAHGLGRAFAAETGFLLARDPDVVRAPDAAFVRRERFEAVGRVRGYWPGAPDLAVEVVSPNDRPGELAQKVATWLAHGTRLVIVAYPDERRVRLHRPGQPVADLTDADTLDAGDVVPGWTLPVHLLFD